MADQDTGSVGHSAHAGGVTVDPVRVFISYAHDDSDHEDRVREFWTFLRGQGVDARLDKPAAERRQDWALWMPQEMRAAMFVLVVASPADRKRAEGDAAPGEGRGVQWEAALIREEVLRRPQRSVAADCAGGAVSRAPMRLDDLASTLADDPQPASTAELEELDDDVQRLVDLTLLTSGPDIAMHPWTAELVERRATSLAGQLQRALAMRMRRFAQGGGYLDLLDVCRHHAALHQYDDLAAVAQQSPQMLAIAERLAAADPGNTEWQRDLSVSHERLGDLAVAAGDLGTAQHRFQAGLAIRERLAAADPSNATWQRDLSIIQQRLTDLETAQSS